MTDVNVHRVIRRSTTYGVPYAEDATSAPDDETPHGLYFLFTALRWLADDHEGASS